MKTVLLLLILVQAVLPLGAEEDFLRGSVVKSDKWKMDRVHDREIFEGNVSFRNPRYTLKADYALYLRPVQTWNITGSVYILRRFDDRSQVVVDCDTALYNEKLEEATLGRGALPVRMSYTGADGRVLRGRADKTFAENKKGLMKFEGNFSLSTENLDMYSQKGLYDNKEGTFLMYESTPLAVGNRQGFDFAINAEKIKFFSASRDLKFYNRVTGWVKDVAGSVKPAAAKTKN